MGKGLKRILSVDDSKDVGRLIHQMIRDKNVDLFTAYSGKEAMDIMNKNDIDAVLLDINMPEESGIEVLRHIRESGFDTKVIMLTARNDRETVLDCYFEKADDFLLKPIKKQNLIDKLDGVLGEL